MIDIHCHIIPGVDDGSRSYEMSLEMLKQAQREGIWGIVATPHCRPERWEYSIDEIKAKMAILEEMGKKEGIDVKLYLGSELRWRDSLPERLGNNQCLTMAGSDYILVEFGTGDSFRTIDRALLSLLAEGFYPIVAHIERYEALRKEFDSIQDWIDKGIRIQCNASAVAGNDGFMMARFTHKLLSYDMVHMIATDAHSNTWRHADMGKCRSYLQKKCGIDKTEDLLVNNPVKMLENRKI